MRNRKIFLSIVILSLLLAACSELPAGIELPNTGEQAQPEQTERATERVPEATETEAVRDIPQEVGGFEEFVAALEAAGAQVEVVGDFDQELPFFDVAGHILRVNGADVQVLEFADEESRLSAESIVRDRSSAIEDVLPEWITQANIWSGDRIIVLYVGEDSEIIRLISSVLGDPIVFSSEQTSTDSEAVMQVVRQMLQTLSPALDRVSFLSIERTEFPDGCLDLPEQDEACTQVITPGFLIVVEIDGQRFVFHSDESGQNIRQE